MKEWLVIDSRRSSPQDKNRQQQPKKRKEAASCSPRNVTIKTIFEVQVVTMLCTHRHPPSYDPSYINRLDDDAPYTIEYMSVSSVNAAVVFVAEARYVIINVSTSSFNNFS